MTILWASVAVLGLALSTWAYVALPRSTYMAPIPPIVKINTGPYRWMKHPMYVGNVAFVAGLGGLGSGIWGALAIGFTAEMIMRDWIHREKG